MIKKTKDIENVIELLKNNKIHDAPTETMRVDFIDIVIGIGKDDVAYLSIPKETFEKLCEIDKELK